MFWDTAPPGRRHLFWRPSLSPPLPR